MTSLVLSQMLCLVPTIHTYSAAQAIAPLISANISADDQVTFAIGLVGMAETVSRQVLRQGRDFDPQSLGRTLASFAWGGLRSVGEPNNQ